MISFVDVGVESIPSARLVEGEEIDEKEEERFRYSGSPNIILRHCEADVDTWFGADFGIETAPLSASTGGMMSSLPSCFLTDIHSWTSVTRRREVTSR